VADALLIDPFAGSGNTLYWMLRHLPGARGVGFELDVAVFQLTRQNLATLALPVEILNTDYVSGLAAATMRPDQLLITFVAPPWGDALSWTSGLDLRRTTPSPRSWTCWSTASGGTGCCAPSRSSRRLTLPRWPS
jgi:16S rRNA G966 N2-methylase RsmD